MHTMGGTTLSWTEHYGDRESQARLERLQDFLFALTLVAFTAGVVGFLTHQPPAPRTAVTASVTSAS